MQQNIDIYRKLIIYEIQLTDQLIIIIVIVVVNITIIITIKSAAHWRGRGAWGPALQDPQAGNHSHWCGAWCWIPRTFLWLVHMFSEFDEDKMSKWLLTQDKAFTSNLMQAPLSLHVRNFQILMSGVGSIYTPNVIVPVNSAWNMRIYISRNQ